ASADFQQQTLRNLPLSGLPLHARLAVITALAKLIFERLHLGCEVERSVVMGAVLHGETPSAEADDFCPGHFDLALPGSRLRIFEAEDDPELLAFDLGWEVLPGVSGRAIERKIPNTPECDRAGEPVVSFDAETQGRGEKRGVHGFRASAFRMIERSRFPFGSTISFRILGRICSMVSIYRRLPVTSGALAYSAATAEKRSASP